MTVLLIGAGLPRFPGFAPWCRRLDGWPALLILAAGLAVFVPNRAHGWNLQKQPADTPLPSVPEVQATVRVLKELPIAAPIVILESEFARASYAELDFVYCIGQWQKSEDFWSFMNQFDISVVVLNQRLETDTRFRDDPGFRDFVSGLRPGPFRMFPVPNTNVTVAVRQDKLGL